MCLYMHKEIAYVTYTVINFPFYLCHNQWFHCLCFYSAIRCSDGIKNSVTGLRSRGQHTDYIMIHT